jgi:hypothetical protein
MNVYSCYSLHRFVAKYMKDTIYKSFIYMSFTRTGLQCNA